MQLNVGLTNLVGHVSRYAERFDVLELRFDPARLPTTKALRRLRAAAPEKLVFSALVPPGLSGPALEHPERLDAALELLDVLGARWVVIQTGSEVGPSARAPARLTTLARKLEGPTRRVAWEPRGPWEPAVAHAAAREMGVTLVEDLSMVDAPPSAVVYTRLRVPGPGAALRSSALERLAERIADSNEVYVIIEGRGSARARSLIERALGVAIANAEDEEDDMAYGVTEDDAFESPRGLASPDEFDGEDSDVEDDESDEFANENDDEFADEDDGLADEDDDEGEPRSRR